MAEDEHAGGEKPASIVGNDPKKRKLMAVGIGVAALVVLFILFKKSTPTPAATDTSASTTGSGTIADVTVPSGSDDQSAQYASTIQAGFGTLNSSIAGEFADLTTLLQAQGTSQPGSPSSALPADMVVGGKTGDPYLYGQDQLNYLKSTGSASYQNVQTAYDVFKSKFGQTMADQAHYSDPSGGTTVYEVPHDVYDASQIYTTKLNASGVNKGGTVTNAGGVHTAWPTVWSDLQQPGVTNTSIAPATNAIGTGNPTPNNTI